MGGRQSPPPPSPAETAAAEAARQQQRLGTQIFEETSPLRRGLVGQITAEQADPRQEQLRQLRDRQSQAPGQKGIGFDVTDQQQVQPSNIDQQIAQLEADIARNPFTPPGQRPVTAQEATFGAPENIIQQILRQQTQAVGLPETPEFTTQRALDELGQPLRIEEVKPITFQELETSPIFGAIKAASETQAGTARRRALADLPAGGAQFAVLGSIANEAARTQAGVLGQLAESERSVREARAVRNTELEAGRRLSRAGLVEGASVRDLAARERANERVLALLGEAAAKRERDRTQALQVAAGGTAGISQAGQAGTLLAQIAQSQALQAQAAAQRSSGAKGALGSGIGSLAGGVLGSVVPGIGTAAGAAAGGAAGGSAGKSDARLKTRIRPLVRDAIKVLAGINVREFSFSADDEERNCIGFIAQELISVLPEAVIEGGDMRDWEVDYRPLIGILISAVKDLQCEIEELKGSLHMPSHVIQRRGPGRPRKVA